MMNRPILQFLIFLTFFVGILIHPVLAEQPKGNLKASDDIQSTTLDETKTKTKTKVKLKEQVKGGDFSLIGKNGQVNLSDFRGKVVALYFGYTQCPDVCPTSLSLLASAIAQLTPEEKKHFQSIFVSVDPGRDTVEILADYVSYFDKEMIGLSAAPDILDPIVAQYGAYYEKVPYSNSALTYGVDHTSETYIIGRDGKLFAVLPHATDSETILKMIRTAMKESE